MPQRSGFAEAGIRKNDVNLSVVFSPLINKGVDLGDYPRVGRVDLIVEVAVLGTDLSGSLIVTTIGYYGSAPGF